MLHTPPTREPVSGSSTFEDLYQKGSKLLRRANYVDGAFGAVGRKARHRLPKVYREGDVALERISHRKLRRRPQHHALALSIPPGAGERDAIRQRTRIGEEREQ